MDSRGQEERITLAGAFVDQEDDDWIVFDPATLGAAARIPTYFENAEEVARKFAAVEDLLAALRQFVAWDEDPHATEDDALALRRAVNAAITKATGSR